MRIVSPRLLAAGALALSLPVTMARAQPAAPPSVARQGQPSPAPSEPGELVRAVQNPVADLISVPLQNNFDYNIGPFHRARYTLNIEPLFPSSLTENWSLITRTILPVIWQPDPNDPVAGEWGLGDLNPTFFFTPSRQGRLIWGAGPIFSLPTATATTTGNGKWCVGPSGVILIQPGKWTLGTLGSLIWSFAGPDDRSKVSFLTLQYFIDYNLSRGWYVTSAPILTANFKASHGSEWVVPFGGGFGRVFALGGQHLNGQVSAYNNIVDYANAPTPGWQLRIHVAFLFPKKG
jgi:hypothetical protein